MEAKEPDKLDGSGADAFEGPGAEGMFLDRAAPVDAPLSRTLLTTRPFLWLVLGEGIAALAFWAYLPITFAEASFRFNASPGQMSLLLASFSLPFVLFNPIQGTIVDRWSPKWLNVFGYLALIAAIPLAMAATSLPWLYASVFMIGVADAAIQPSRSALTGLIVPEGRLIQANGLLWAAIHLALVVGPLAGGILQRTSGNDVALAAALGVATLSLPFFLLVPDRRPQGTGDAFRLRDLGEGLAATIRNRELRVLLLFAAAMFLTITTFWALEPLFVRHTLHRSGDALSFLWAAHGGGAFLGAVAVSRMKEGTRRELLLVGTGLLATGAGLLAYAGSASYPLALAGSVSMGTGLSLYFAPALALIQRVAGEAKRGRVTSVFAVLQEGVGLATSLTIAVLGIALAAVRPALIGGGVVVGAAGLWGLRAFGRLRRREGVSRSGEGSADG